MVEQIGTAIIMFLLGSVLTYFSTRWSRTLHKIESLEHGVQALLRDRMLQMYSYYKEKQKPVPLREVESFEAMFSAYKEHPAKVVCLGVCFVLCGVRFADHHRCDI